MSIVPSNFIDLSKEFKTDEDGKGFVSWRGLGRLCGVTHKNFGKSGYQFTLEIDQYLADAGIQVGTMKPGCSGAFFTLEIDECLVKSEIQLVSLLKVVVVFYFHNLTIDKTYFGGRIKSVKTLMREFDRFILWNHRNDLANNPFFQPSEI